jgi:hypothetical protein
MHYTCSLVLLADYDTGEAEFYWKFYWRKICRPRSSGLCRHIDGYYRFGGTYYLYLQGENYKLTPLESVPEHVSPEQNFATCLLIICPLGCCFPFFYAYVSRLVWSLQLFLPEFSRAVHFVANTLSWTTYLCPCFPERGLSSVQPARGPFAVIHTLRPRRWNSEMKLTWCFI